MGSTRLQTEVAVVGGGIAGLSAAFELDKQGVEYTLIESTKRWGGKIASDRETSGFVVERGADSVLDLKPDAVELIAELGLGSQLISSRSRHRGTQIWHRDRLIPLPPGWRMLVPTRSAPFMVSPLLSWPGKLRVLAERWQPVAPTTGDESLATFVERRIGREALAQIGEPFLSHIHVGDIERMSVQSTYPALATIERRFGNLHVPNRPQHRPIRFSTLEQGLESMVESLVDRLDRRGLQLGRAAVALTAAPPGVGSRYRLRLDDGTTIECNRLILAIPASSAQRLLASVAPKCSGRLGSLRSSSIATVTVAYDEQDLPRPLATFGAFVPRSAKRHILACTWTSNKFSARCPPGSVLIRAFVGAQQHQKLAEETELESIVRHELDKMIGPLAGPPQQVWTSRFANGYPQYDVDHSQRISRIEQLAPSGVRFAGSPYHGVGIPDCIASGRRAGRENESKNQSSKSLRS